MSVPVTLFRWCRWVASVSGFGRFVVFRFCDLSFKKKLLTVFAPGSVVDFFAAFVLNKTFGRPGSVAECLIGCPPKKKFVEKV